MKLAQLGTITESTLNPKDLIEAFSTALEGLVLINGDELSKPENFPLRDRLNAIIGDATDAIGDNSWIEAPFSSEVVEEILESLQDALNDFSPPSAYFGAHPDDGSDFGFWLSEEEGWR